MESAVDAACRALGLTHGPIHAECRVNDHGVFILEVAARPIGGICARALRFSGPKGTTATLEALLLRHAIGERVDRWTRRAGRQRRDDDSHSRPRRPARDGRRRPRARRAGHRRRVLTAKIDQTLVPLPEGATYLGFIFARGDSPSEVESALRTAHACLEVRMDRAIPVV